jgi:hypothetical protein
VKAPVVNLQSAIEGKAVQEGEVADELEEEGGMIDLD